MTAPRLRTGTFGWIVIFVSSLLAFVGTKCATYENPKPDQPEPIHNLDNMTRGYGLIGLILAAIGLVTLVAAESIVRHTTELIKWQKGAFIALATVALALIASVCIPNLSGYEFFILLFVLLFVLNLNLLLYAASMERPL